MSGDDIAEDTLAPFRPGALVLRAKRLAVRDDEGAPWRWFGPAVLWTAHNWQSGTSDAVLEDQCAEAIFRYPTQHIRLFEARSAKEFDCAAPPQFNEETRP